MVAVVKSRKVWWTSVTTGPRVTWTFTRSVGTTSPSGLKMYAPEAGPDSPPAFWSPTQQPCDHHSCGVVADLKFRNCQRLSESETEAGSDEANC